MSDDANTMTLVLLVEAENREAIIATLRDVIHDMERGISNCGGGGAGEPQATMDWQINAGAMIAPLGNWICRYYRKFPGKVVPHVIQGRPRP